MKFNSYLANVICASLFEDNGLRVGQVAYNELHKVRPDLTKDMPAEVDAYYDDDKLEAFMDWVEENW